MDNLVRHGTNPFNILCTSGCVLPQTSQHLFVECRYFGNIWKLVWVLSSVLSKCVLNHVHSFDSLCLISKVHIVILCIRFKWIVCRLFRKLKMSLPFIVLGGLFPTYRKELALDSRWCFKIKVKEVLDVTIFSWLSVCVDLV